MNHTCLKLAAVGLLTCLAGGCAFFDPPCDNGSAGNGANGQGNSAGGGGAGGGVGAADSQTGVVAYPYYANRGPRDYFSKPTDIGP